MRPIYNQAATMPMLVAMRSVDEDAAKYIQKLPMPNSSTRNASRGRAMLLVVKT